MNFILVFRLFQYNSSALLTYLEISLWFLPANSLVAYLNLTVMKILVNCTYWNVQDAYLLSLNQSSELHMLLAKKPCVCFPFMLQYVGTVLPLMSMFSDECIQSSWDFGANANSVWGSPKKWTTWAESHCLRCLWAFAEKEVISGTEGFSLLCAGDFGFRGSWKLSF